MRVYLAGGLTTGWQDRVIEACEGLPVTFYNPRDIYPKQYPPEVYTPLEMAAIRSCDVLFDYHEADCPGSANDAWEMGYAAGLGKFVIYVTEKPDKWREMLRVAADMAFTTLTDGINALRDYVEAVCA